MIITTLIIIVTFFGAGFGFGWCLRGDRALKRERELEVAIYMAHDAWLKHLRSNQLERFASRIRQKNKEYDRWN